MADSQSETVIQALHTVLPAAAPAGALVVRDGTPGEPEALLSPLSYHYQHRAEVEVVVDGADAATRDARFDALKQAVTAAIAPDRTLGGTCDWAEAAAPAQEETPLQGGTPLKAGVVPVVLHYATDDPLR